MNAKRLRRFAEDMMTSVLICEAHIDAFQSIVHMDIWKILIGKSEFLIKEFN